MSDALESAALAAKQAGRFDEAIRLFQQQARQQPKAHGPLYNLANTLLAAGRAQEAVDAYRRALRLAPRFAAAHNNLGMAQLAIEDIAHAATSFARAAALEPANPASNYLAGHALLRLNKPAEALPYLATADRLAPHNPITLTDLADALRRTGQTEAVLPPARAAAALAPDRIEVWNNLANAERGMGNLAEAEAASRQALAMQPDDADAHYNLALTLLLAQRLPEAWPHWEYRWQSVTKRPAPLPGPVWDGTPCPGETLYLHAEQGLGDTIQFCRYATLAAARARVVLAVQPQLVRLVQGLPGVAAVMSNRDPRPPYTHQAPLLSLPGAFATTAATIPADTPYLRAEPAALATWRARLADLPGRKIGLVWSGNPDFPFDHLRSIPAERLAPLAAVPGISWVNLQLGAKTHPFPLTDPTASLTDLAETAALIANLDLVIGVDTAVIHLAGALGRPVWLANRWDGDWRWGQSSDTTPWYPTLRQFRQAPDRDWRPVVTALAAALARMS